MNDEPFIYDIVSTMNVYETLKNNHELNRANINKVAECLEFIGGIKREQVPVKARFNMEADDHTVGKHREEWEEVILHYEKPRQIY